MTRKRLPITSGALCSATDDEDEYDDLYTELGGEG